MSLSRFSQSLEKARQDKKLNRSRLVASACLLGVTLSAAGCSQNSQTVANGVGPPPPDVRETPTPHYGGGSGGSGGGGTT